MATIVMGVQVMPRTDDVCGVADRAISAGDRTGAGIMARYR